MTRLGFCQPSSTQYLGGNARQVWLDIEDGRSIEHVDASNMQESVFAAKQSNDCETDRVRTTGRASGKDSVRSIFERWFADQVEIPGPVKLPNDEQMRETLNVGEPDL